MLDWYYLVGVALGLVAFFWGGWKLAKTLPKEAGEALIKAGEALEALTDMVEDNKITRAEIQEWVETKLQPAIKEAKDVKDLIAKLCGLSL